MRSISPTWSATRCSSCWLSLTLLDCASTCSVLSRSSLNSRAFSIAMTAWAAKFSTSAICLSVNGRTSWRYRVDTPDQFVSFSIGTASTVRTPQVRRLQRLPDRVARRSRFCRNIGDVNNALFATIARSSGFRMLGANSDICALSAKARRRIVRRDDAQALAVAAVDVAECRRRRCRTAFSSMAANTGSRSPGELLIT